MRRNVKVNYGKLLDPNKRYKVFSTFAQDGTEYHKISFVKGSDLTENQIKEILNRPDTKVIVKRGGKRSGSGRKKKEPTIVRRYPLVLDEKIQKLILDFRNEKGEIKTMHQMPPIPIKDYSKFKSLGLKDPKSKP